MKRRALNEAEKADAERLSKAWDKEKTRLRISQEEMASRCGWGTQGAFNQYLHGKIPLNIDALLKICDVLDVPVSDISPGIASRLFAATARDSAPSKSTTQQKSNVADSALVIVLHEDEMMALNHIARNDGVDTTLRARMLLVDAIRDLAAKITNSRRITDVLTAQDMARKNKRA